MVKKVKGIKVKNPQLQETHRFTKEGNSQIGTDPANSHALTGTMATSGDVNLDGEIVLDDRISGYLFSPPHIDGADTNQINELMNNISEYEGFMIYLLGASSVEPFVNAQKFYFCENGEWHPSPFSHSGATNYDPNPQPANTAPTINPMYQVLVDASGMETLPFSLDLPADLFIDAEGDNLVYTAELAGGGPLPAWLSFDATGTILSGTPAGSDVGTYLINITATDPGGLYGSTTQGINILVKPMPFWANRTSEGYENPNYPLEEIIYTTGSLNNDLVIDPYYNGDYLITAPDIVDITAGPIEFDFEFDGPLTDGMGIRWGSSSDTTNFCIGLTAPGVNGKVWLGAALVQNKKGSNGTYAEDDSSLDVYPLENYSTDGNANPQVSTNANLAYGSFHRDPPEKSWLSPTDRMVQVPDLEFKIRIDGYRKAGHNNDDAIDVVVVAKHKNIPQSAIDAGFGSVTLDDLLDPTFYATIPSMYQDTVFHRTVDSMLLNGGQATPLGDFQPFVYFDGKNHNDGNYSPNHAAAALLTTSWTQTAYLPPICNYNSTTQLLYTGGTLEDTLPADFIETQNDYSKSTQLTSWGTTINYSAEMQDGSPLPSWIAFNAASRTLTFTPESAEIGFHSVKVIGTDNLGMSTENIRTYEVQQAPPPDEANPSIPTWSNPGNYIVGPGGDLTLDGQATNTWHLVEDTSKQFDLVEGIPYGDTSTALVFEWSFDGSDTAGDGVRNVLSRVGFQSSDTSNEQVRYYMMAPSGGSRTTQGQKRPGNTQNTAYMSLNDAPADWTWRLIIKVDSWFTDGSEKPRGVRWAIAGKKNSGSLTWSDILNSVGSSFGYLETSDGFMRWGSWVNYYGTDSSTAPSEIKYHPFVSSNPQSNNNTAEFHLTNPKIFFVDLDE